MDKCFGYKTKVTIKSSSYKDEFVDGLNDYVIEGGCAALSLACGVNPVYLTRIVGLAINTFKDSVPINILVVEYKVYIIVF